MGLAGRAEAQSAGPGLADERIPRPVPQCVRIAGPVTGRWLRYNQRTLRPNDHTRLASAPATAHVVTPSGSTPALATSNTTPWVAATTLPALVCGIGSRLQTRNPP